MVSNVIRFNSSNYRKVIRHRSKSGGAVEFNLYVFYSDTVLTDIKDLPNIAFRLFEDSAEEPPVFVRLEVYDPSWFDKRRYTELRHLVADLLIHEGIEIGDSEYPNGLLEYLTSVNHSVEVNLDNSIITYRRGFYKWVFKPVEDMVNSGGRAQEKLMVRLLSTSLMVDIDNKPHMVVADTSSAWSTFLSNSYPKWFNDNAGYLQALGRSFLNDVKGTVLEGIAFSS